MVTRIDPQGREQIFADQIQRSSACLLFAREWAAMSLGESCSTGGCHHPDGAIYEIASGVQRRVPA